MEKVANTKIRNSLKEHNLKHWKLAQLLGVSESTLVRKLRNELSNEEKAHILEVISHFPTSN